MSSDELNFWDGLCHEIERRALGSTSYEPIYYVVFDPQRTVEIQKEIRAFTVKLQENGYTPTEFNCFDELWNLLEADADWSEIEEWDRENPLEWGEMQGTLSAIAEGGDSFVERLRKTLRTACAASAQSSKSVVLVTSLEVLHGFTRPGHIESQLNGEFGCPTIFFYPGRTEGKSGLRFLNFYDLDANYRSAHLEVP